MSRYVTEELVVAWLDHQAQMAEDAGDTDGQWLIESLRLAVGGGGLGRYVARFPVKTNEDE